MSHTINYNSRQIISKIVGETQFNCGINKLSVEDISLYLNGDFLTLGTDYDWEEDNLTVTLTVEPVADSVLEMVRLTVPENPVVPTPLELLRLIEEARDEAALNNGHGAPLRRNDTGPSLPTNRFLIAGGTPGDPGDYVDLPTTQLLPDGGLAADPDSENPGGFEQAAFRSQHRFPGTLEALSHPIWWLSGVIEDPLSPATASHNYSFYGLKVTLKGYQEWRDPFYLANSAINVISTTGPGVVRGDSQGIVCEARHEAIQASLTWPESEEDLDSQLIFTAQGVASMRGDAGDGFEIKINEPAANSAVEVPTQRRLIITPKIGEDTAEEVADLVNDYEEGGVFIARELVRVEYGGDGDGTVFDTGGNYEILSGGANCNGRLVGNQTITRPQGIDHGPGYVSDSGQLVLAHADAEEDYAYVANSNGFYRGFMAYIAKSKPEPEDPFDQGWQNAFGADDKSIKSRLLWLYKYVTIEVPNFAVDEPSGEGMEIRKHNSVWMGLGTDRPETSLHIKTFLIDEESDPQTPEVPELRFDKVEQHTGADVLAKIAMYGRGNVEDPETQAMTEIVGRLDAWTDGVETSRLSFSTMLEGTFADRWHIGGGLWSEGASASDMGPGSINVESVHVGGTKVIEADAVTGDGARIILGPPADVSIVSGAIPFRRTNTTVTATGGGDVIAITGGEEGAWIIIRPGATSGAIVVKNNATGGNIRCAADITLGNARKSVQLLYSGSEWVRFPTD